MKRKMVVLFAAGILSACQPSEQSLPDPTAVPTGGGGEPVAVVLNIDPVQLKIGKVDAPLCAEVVVVHNPEVACQQHDCGTKVFHSELMAIKKGQRALRIFDCEKGNTKPHLLTDLEPRFNSTAILVLQDKRDGENLWSQLKEGDEYTIELATEAAEGTLSLNAQGKYEWHELPD